MCNSRDNSFEKGFLILYPAATIKISKTYFSRTLKNLCKDWKCIETESSTSTITPIVGMIKSIRWSLAIIPYYIYSQKQ